MAYLPRVMDRFQNAHDSKYLCKYTLASLVEELRTSHLKLIHDLMAIIMLTCDVPA